MVPEADEIRPLKEEGVMDIAYDRVQAVGDILIITPDLPAEKAPISP
jgi:sporulation protein YlmC with PRC-barrel domain